LALKPDHPVALFNRAIVGEQLHLYRQSLDDAERYLKIEPNSEWTGEASARANDIRAKLKKHDQSHATPLLSPRSWCCPPATRVSALKWISASKNI